MLGISWSPPNTHVYVCTIGEYVILTYWTGDGRSAGIEPVTPPDPALPALKVTLTKGVTPVQQGLGSVRLFHRRRPM